MPSDPIKHVIVLMLENNSFDHVLGSLTAIKKIDGVPQNSPYSNSYYDKVYVQTITDSPVVSPDPKHDLTDALIQIEKDNKGNTMSGFVTNYAQSYRNKIQPSQYGQVMYYYKLGSLPVLHELAKQFVICDHWFSSLPGPTWPNRLFAMTGTSMGRVTMPSGIMNLNLHFYDQPTIFDRLNEKGISWKVYFGDIPVSMALAHQWEPQNSVRHRPLLELFSDLTESEIPEFVWIEPNYLPPTANDYHPPHNVFRGEKLVADVYNALRANEELWNSSLFVILFDEHGGLYDHVTPPSAVPPDNHHEEWTFDQLGVRVPAILVSPWVGNGVISDTFDHTSLLRYLIDKWRLRPLGERTANAKSFVNAISSSNCRTDTPKQLTAPPVDESQNAPEELTEFQQALISLSHILESKAGEDVNVVADRSIQVLNGISEQVDVAIKRVESFLFHKKSN